MAKREPYSADVPIDVIYEGENLSREYYGDLKPLAKAIASNQWLAPLQVVKEGKRYRLVAGYRRLRAVGMLRERGDWAEETVPCQVFTTLADAAGAALNVAENSERLNPNYAETFAAYRQLKERYGLTTQQITERVGRSVSHVNNCIYAASHLHPAILKSLANIGDRRPPMAMTALFRLAYRPLDEQLKSWTRLTAVDAPANSSEAGELDDIAPAPKPKRRREIELAIKDLRRIGDDECQFAVKVLQWTLGERTTAPWDED